MSTTQDRRSRSQAVSALPETPVVPGWMHEEACVRQYHSGMTWFHVGKTDRIDGPLTERYLLDNLKWLSTNGYFNGKRDHLALEHLGFILGMLSQQK